MRHRCTAGRSEPLVRESLWTSTRVRQTRLREGLPRWPVRQMRGDGGRRVLVRERNATYHLRRGQANRVFR